MFQFLPPRFCIGLIIFLITATASLADSYMAFDNFLIVDPSGRYYLVVKKAKGVGDDAIPGCPVTFELAERAAGSPPIASAEARRRGDKILSDVRVRDCDKVIGRGNFERCPRMFLLSSTGLGFVGLGVGGNGGFDTKQLSACVIVAPDGAIRHRKSIDDLFGSAESSRFPLSAGSIWWLGGGWIDENRREVVVVSSGLRETFEQKGPLLFRKVRLDDGAVTDGSIRNLIAVLRDRDDGALVEVLLIVEERKMKEALEFLPGILDDKKHRLLTRVHCATALAAFGDHRGAQLMEAAALSLSDAQDYAVRYLPDLLGDKAAPILCNIVRQFGDPCFVPASHAMSSVSSNAALPELISMLGKNENPVSINFAVVCLGIFGSESKPAIPALQILLDDKSSTRLPLTTIQNVAGVLAECGPDAKSALPLLEQLAQQHEAEAVNRMRTQKPYQPLYTDRDRFVRAILKIRDE